MRRLDAFNAEPVAVSATTFCTWDGKSSMYRFLTRLFLNASTMSPSKALTCKPLNRSVEYSDASSYGAKVGSCVGASDGNRDGKDDGAIEGSPEGARLGTAEGGAVGSSDGNAEGCSVGAYDGSALGSSEGVAVG